MTKTAIRKGKQFRHMLITVGALQIPSLRKRIIQKYIITLDNCYAVVYAESIEKALTVIKNNFNTRNIKSIEIA